MTRVVVLDTGPLGMIAHPKKNPAVGAWIRNLVQDGNKVVVPEIADYEVRRELLRAKMSKSVKRLDRLKTTLYYLPLTTPAMIKAAEFWADARRRGRPSADDKALDGDVILAAQTSLLVVPGMDTIIATDNVGHLSRYVPATQWQKIA